MESQQIHGRTGWRSIIDELCSTGRERASVKEVKQLHEGAHRAVICTNRGDSILRTTVQTVLVQFSVY